MKSSRNNEVASSLGIECETVSVKFAEKHTYIVPIFVHCWTVLLAYCDVVFHGSKFTSYYSSIPQLKIKSILFITSDRRAVGVLAAKRGLSTPP